MSKKLKKAYAALRLGDKAYVQTLKAARNAAWAGFVQAIIQMLFKASEVSTTIALIALFVCAEQTVEMIVHFVCAIKHAHNITKLGYSEFELERMGLA